LTRANISSIIEKPLKYARSQTGSILMEETKMGRLVKFEVGELPDVLIVGKELRCNMEELMKGNNPIPAFWGKCFEENIFATLEEQTDLIYNKDYVGIMLDWNNDDSHTSYIVGMLMKPGAAVPAGYFSRDLEATKVAIGFIQGKDTPDVCSNAHELTEQALKSEDFTCEKMTWCMELYNCPRYTTPDENDEIILDYYIPID
jgi:predicted transcriptional regulator YdeE